MPINDRRIYRLTHETARRLAAAYCMNAPEGYICKIEEPKKSREQEEKYHAMIGDIAKCVPFMGEMQSTETWKRLLVDAFVKIMREEAKASGEPDPFRGDGQVIPSLDGEGFVQLGVQTRRFKKSVAMQFIEYLYAWGSHQNPPVVWSDAAQWDERFAA